MKADESSSHQVSGAVWSSLAYNKIDFVDPHVEFIKIEVARLRRAAIFIMA
jgi:hypothetical protein